MAPGGNEGRHFFFMITTAADQRGSVTFLLTKDGQAFNAERWTVARDNNANNTVTMGLEHFGPSNATVTIGNNWNDINPATDDNRITISGSSATVVREFRLFSHDGYDSGATNASAGTVNVIQSIRGNDFSMLTKVGNGTVVVPGMGKLAGRMLATTVFVCPLPESFAVRGAVTLRSASLASSMACATESASRIAPRSESDRRATSWRLSCGSCSSNSAAVRAATSSLVVIRTARAWGSCSAWASRSAAMNAGLASLSATISTSLGPAIMSMRTLPMTWRLASATYWLPGPTITSTAEMTALLTQELTFAASTAFNDVEIEEVKSTDGSNIADLYQVANTPETTAQAVEQTGRVDRDVGVDRGRALTAARHADALKAASAEERPRHTLTCDKHESMFAP